jgi:hypothetical protein
VLPPKKAIPIFCVSGNCIYDEYEWDCVDEKIPGNTPVLWVNMPGLRGIKACLCIIMYGKNKNEISWE